MATVTISRDKQYKTAMRNSQFAWKWIYSWSSDDNAHLAQVGDRVCDIGTHYGTDLGSLRGMLRRKFDGSLTIVEDWKVAV